MNAKLLKGINEHLTLEFKASHEYLAMSVWLSEHDLPGFATARIRGLYPVGGGGPALQSVQQDIFDEVSEADSRLIAAPDRLADGRSETTDGALHVTNLCAEDRV